MTFREKLIKSIKEIEAMEQDSQTQFMLILFNRTLKNCK